MVGAGAAVFIVSAKHFSRKISSLVYVLNDDAFNGMIIVIALELRYHERGGGHLVCSSSGS